MAAAVYAAIAAITQEFSGAGIAKTHLNSVAQYQYRSIDDVMARLAPLLARHRLCVLPRMLERSVDERHGLGEGLLIHVALRVAYTLVSAEDGSSHVVEAYAEALDGGDKATAKALSSAFKSAMLQSFCIPVTSGEEPDSVTHKLARGTHEAEPVEGWPSWVQSVIDTIGICESLDAMTSVQSRHRSLLLAVSRERPDLYAAIGQAFADRRQSLGEKRSAPAPKRGRREAAVKRAKAPEQEVMLG